MNETKQIETAPPGNEPAGGKPKSVARHLPTVARIEPDISKVNPLNG